MLIDNQIPDSPDPTRLAIITDVPPPIGAATGDVMAGGTKNIVSGILKQQGVDYKRCFVGALCQAPIHFPNFLRDKKMYAEHTERLVEDLKEYNPSIIITLGKEVSTFFKGGDIAIVDERGYPLITNVLGGQHIVLPTFHPVMTFKVYKWTHLLRFDLAKAVRLAKVPGGFTPLQRNINIIRSPQELKEILQAWLAYDQLVSWDTETFDNPRGKFITMMSFSADPAYGIVLPFVGNGGHYWDEENERQIWKILAFYLRRLRLVGHNAVHYDHYVTSLFHLIEPNVVEDTMHSHWEAFCEMKKSLGFLGSLYTDNPEWKKMRGASGVDAYQKQLTYSGLDACGTKEIADGVLTDLKDEPPSVQAHYCFNLRLSKAVQYMGIGGMRINREKHQERLKELRTQQEELQAELDKMVGYHLNVNSSPQKKDYLYNRLRLPRAYKPVKDEFGDVENRETTEYLALLRLRLEYPDIEALRLMLRLTKLNKRISNLSFTLSDRGRVHAIYNVVGTETGRVSCYKGHDYYGLQLQTVTEDDRDLFLPDEGYLWFKADLEGADNWTVAAFSAFLGDPTMLNDLREGVKPAQMIGIMDIHGAESRQWDYPALRAEAKRIKKEYPDRYAVHKAVTHGSSYAMKPPRMSEIVLLKSKGEIVVSPSDCNKLQGHFFTRYPGVKEYQRYIDDQLRRQGYLQSASGTRRYFLDRVTASATSREGYAQMPQANTTYATNRTVLGIYENPANRRGGEGKGGGLYGAPYGAKKAGLLAAPTPTPGGKAAPLNGQNYSPLVLAPTHQMHDEIDCQFRPDDRDRARKIFWEAADQPMEIAGTEIVIPWETGVGETWKDAKEEL